MATMPVAAPLTAEEFVRLPLLERGRRELVGGEVVMSDPAYPHQEAVLAIASALRSWCKAAEGRGFATLNIDVGLSSQDVLQPDAQWYAAGREFADPARRPQPVGDLVVEVRSPTTWHRDVGVKRRLYERHGVRELWLVDPPARSVLVFRRSLPASPVFDRTAELGEDAPLTSPLLPGFSLPVADVFG